MVRNSHLIVGFVCNLLGGTKYISIYLDQQKEDETCQEGVKNNSDTVR